MQKSYSYIAETVRKIICENTGLKYAVVQEKDDFESLGLDQLDLVNLILALEKEFFIIIPDEVSLNTISDVVQYVYALKAA